MAANRWYTLRWRVLERDHFTCQYCGQHVPDVVLHVDHRVPVSAGGTNDIENLVAACSACNLGKMQWVDAFTNLSNRSRSGNRLDDEVVAYLAAYGPASATDISHGIQRDRANISTLLTKDPRFVALPKQGKNVPYALVLPDGQQA